MYDSRQWQTRRAKRLLIRILFLLLAASLFAQSPVIKVDFNMIGRPPAEGYQPGYTPWDVPQTNSDSLSIDGINFTLAKTGSNGTGLRSVYFKAGILTPYYVKLANDGVYVADGTGGAEMELTLSGLPAGTHTLVTYHNHVDNPASNTFAPLDIFINGNQVVDNLVPSVRVLSEDDAKTAFLSFSVSAGQNVVIRFAAERSSSASNKNVILNAFELNVPDPASQAINPTPADYDEHYDADSGNVTLRWSAAAGAVSHDVYLGTSQSALAGADRSSSEYKGNQGGTSYNISKIIKTATYYWRIDEVASGGTITRGNIWMFRPRQLAFPGAEGYGRFAHGGRGGVVVHVTNLNDSGSGSMREAVENDALGPRTVVFDVAGIITLSDRMVINDKYVTVAGQTAPGKGIVIRSAPFGTSGAQDIIIQNVRVRLGAGITYDGMGMAGTDYSIIDHCSISWTIDESFSSRNGRNLTLQRTLISEALNVAGHDKYGPGAAHGYAATISGDIGSFHHNLLAHNAGRNWSLGGGLDGNGDYAGRLDIFNNVVYNWDSRTTDGGAHEVNFVNNYYKPGAATSIFTALNPQYDGFPGTQQYYMSGNVMPGHFDESNQMAGASPDKNPPYPLWVSAPFFPSYATLQTAREAYKSVLSDVGCIQPVLDEHDVRVIRETLEGTYTYRGSKTNLPGLPDHESDVGGYENYPNASRDSSWDTDGDGLPNWWENYYGLNVNSGSGNFQDTNADPDNDGYTNLDYYLQWMAKPHYFIETSQTVQINLARTFVGYTSSPSYSVSEVVGGSAGISGGTVTFTPAACGMASFTLKVTDAQGASMTKEIVVFVAGDCSGATPGPTPTPTLSAGLCGDVNNSATVDIIDALMTAQYYVGLNPAGFIAGNADVNGDNVINIIDALMIAQKYVGLLSSLSC